MYRNKHELNTALYNILMTGLVDDGSFNTERERLAYHLAHFHTEKCFFKWDWAPDEEREKMVNEFLSKHCLKPDRRPNNPEEAMKLLEEDYLSFEPLESIYKHMIKMADGERYLSRMHPEPITYPQKQHSLLHEEHAF